MRKRTLLLPLLALVGLGSLVACSPVGTLNAVVSTSGLTVTRDLHYGPDARNVLDLYAPQKASGLPVVLFIHGGSWTSGDKNEYKFVGDSLARGGYLVAVMSYRLAPEHPYPDYIQDAAQALRWLRDHARDYGGDPDDLFVSGHSAGAFNAVEVVDNARWLAEAGVPVSAVRGVVGVAGPYSYDYRTLPSRNAFPAGSDPANTMPSGHVRPDAPPHLLLVAGNDQTVEPANATRMEAALKAAGVPVTLTVIPRLNHYTIIGALARPLTFLGPTRSLMLNFLKQHQTPVKTS
ncbi:alpha/beta hydrolase [Deinococcus sonorensis]|uniref:Alpha/beta hydrolase n=2 Tax=Deinococcus sonorensis TaxID=309891 RepID=A0AAU7U9K2_9DEIO